MCHGSDCVFHQDNSKHEGQLDEKEKVISPKIKSTAKKVNKPIMLQKEFVSWTCAGSKQQTMFPSFLV